MYRLYKKRVLESSNPSAQKTQPIKNQRTSRIEAVVKPLPSKSSSASDALRMAGDEHNSTNDILDKIRETVDTEIHGECFVFVVLGASVCYQCFSFIYLL